MSNTNTNTDINTNNQQCTTINSQSTAINSSYEDLKRKVQSAGILVRDLHLRNMEFNEVLTKKGFLMGMLCFEYLNPIYDDADWKQRRVPVQKDEAKVIVEAGPYESDHSLYRVTAVQKNGFYEWTSIELLDDADIESEESR